MLINENHQLMMVPVLTVVILFCSIVTAYASYGETVPIFYIDARGKTGTQIGTEYGNLIQDTYASFETKLDSYLNFLLSGSQANFNDIAANRLPLIKANVSSQYQDEVNAILAVIGTGVSNALNDGKISSDEFWMIQLIPDIVRTTNCSGFGVFGDYAQDNSPIVGRNLEWTHDANLRAISAVTVYQYDDYELVNVGYAGYCGVVSGYNSFGLYAAILDSSLEGSYPDPPTGKRSYPFDIRAALEHYQSISAAADTLANNPYAYSHNILFADTVDVQIQEHPQGVSGVLRTDGSSLRAGLAWGKTNQIPVVNFFALPGYVNGSASDTVRWNRYKDLALFSSGSRADTAAIESIMLDIANAPNAIFDTSSVVQTMVFTPANRELYLLSIPVSGTHPISPELQQMQIMLHRPTGIALTAPNMVPTAINPVSGDTGVLAFTVYGTIQDVVTGCTVTLIGLAATDADSVGLWYDLDRSGQYNAGDGFIGNLVNCPAGDSVWGGAVNCSVNGSDSFVVTIDLRDQIDTTASFTVSIDTANLVCLYSDTPSNGIMLVGSWTVADSSGNSETSAWSDTGSVTVFVSDAGDSTLPNRGDTATAFQSIQGAINALDPGNGYDTVVVYSRINGDSYWENVAVDIGMTLISYKALYGVDTGGGADAYATIAQSGGNVIEGANSAILIGLIIDGIAGNWGVGHAGIDVAQYMHISDVSAFNCDHGIYLLNSSNNLIATNQIYSNYPISGISVVGSDNNSLLNNRVYNTLLNSAAGIEFISSNYNYVAQNTIDSNVLYGFKLSGTSTADTVVKNNYTPSMLYPDSGVYSDVMDTSFDFTRNWWGTTDNAVIAGYVHGPGADSIVRVPFRLGLVDTAANADTIAPAAPAYIAAAAVSSSSCSISWEASSTNEEIGGALSDLAGYRVYRSQTSDTNWWYRVADVENSDSYTDSGLIADTIYYYRVTAYDNHSPWENESWYSDSIVSATTTAETTTAGNRFQFSPSTLAHTTPGDTEPGGIPYSSLQVNTGDSVTLHVWVTFDPAYAATAWGATDLWMNWDPTQLRLDDSYSMVPNVAATPSVPNGVPGYTEDTSQGLFIRSIDYGTFGQMTSGEVFAISFKVLGSGGALITMKSDTIPETNITGSGVWDGGGNETIGFNSYSITLSSSETDSPVITTPVIAGFVHANTQTVNVTVTDSSTALGNMNFTMWVNSDSTGGVWRTILADSYTISGTYANFGCTVPGDSIGGAFLYYFFTASDSWGNWDTDLMYLSDSATWNNDFDTNIAWVTAIATAVPVTFTAWGDGATDTRLSPSLYDEWRFSQLVLNIQTMGDTITVYNTAISDSDPAIGIGQVVDLAAEDRQVGCTLPIREGYNRFWFTVEDTFLSTYTSETYTIIGDSVAPLYGAGMINNGNATMNTLSCSVYVTAADSYTVSGYYVDVWTMAGDTFEIYNAETFILTNNGDTLSVYLQTVNNVSDTGLVSLWVVAYDSAGNWDTGTAFTAEIYVDTAPPVMPVWQAPADSSVRTGENLVITNLVFMDSSAISGFMVYRHPGLAGQTNWDSQPWTLLSQNTYGCTIPADSVGYAGLNDASYGLEFFGMMTDVFGYTTYVDSMGVDYSMSRTIEQVYANPDSFTTADSVAIWNVVLITYDEFENGWYGTPMNVGDTVYLSADTGAYVIFRTNADTVQLNGSFGQWTETGVALSQTTGLVGWADTLWFNLYPGANYFDLGGQDDTEPNRFGDTYYVICDSAPPIINVFTLESGAIAVDSGATPTLTATFNSADSQWLGGPDGTPDTILLSATVFYSDTYAWTAIEAGGIAYTGTATCTWAGADTFLYRWYLYAADRAGNISALAADDIYQDTYGPQVEFAGIPDQRSAAQSYTFTFDVYDTAGISAVAVSAKHDTVGQAAWTETAAANVGGSVYQATIDSSLVGSFQDDQEGVKYYIRTLDNLGHYTYFGVPIGVAGGAFGNWDTSAANDTYAQTDWYYDTFSVVLSVPTIVTVSGTNITGGDTLTMAGGLYFASSSIYMTLVTQYADSIAIGNQTTGETFASLDPIDGVGNLYDTNVTLQLAKGLNVLVVDVKDTDMPSFWSAYNVWADTEKPMITDGGFLAVHTNPLTYDVFTDSSGVSFYLTATDTDYAMYQMRIDEDTGWGAWQAWADTVIYGFADPDSVIALYIVARDQAGNVSDTLWPMIYHDTAGPAIAHTAAADSRAANQTLNLTAALDDFSGTNAVLQAFIWFSNDNQYAGAVNGWDSQPMLRTNPVSATWNCSIPAAAIGSQPDSAVSYFLEAYDTWNYRSYFYGGGASDTITLPAAQANPMSFTTVGAIGVTALVYTALLTDTQTLSDSIYVNNGIVNLYLLSPDADTITIGQYTGDWSLVDTYTLTIATALASETTTIINLVDNINILYLLVEDSAVSPQPELRAAYAFYCDTYASVLYDEELTAGDTVAIDTGAKATADTAVTVFLNLTDTDHGYFISDGADGKIAWVELAETSGFNINATGRMAYTNCLPCTSFVFTDLTDTALTIFMRCWDDAGNTSATISRTILYDTAGPVINFTALTDSQPTNREVTVTATILDLACDTPLLAAIVTYHASTSATWETWPMTGDPWGNFSAAIPDTVVGSSPDLAPGLQYSIAASDSFGNWTYTVSNIYFATGVCTDVAYARVFADSFTVANAVAVASYLQDRQSDTNYFGADTWPSSPLDVYSSDSLTLQVVTDADSLAVYVFSSDLATRLLTLDTISLTQGAAGQSYVFSLADTVIADTMFIQVYAFDYTEPVNTETYAIVCDTTSPGVISGPWIDMFGAAFVSDTYSTADSRVVVSITAWDTCPWNTVAYRYVAETDPRALVDTWTRTTDADNYKYWVRYDSPINYTIINPVAAQTLYVAVSDSAGNIVVAQDAIFFDTMAPEVFLSSFTDSKSTNQQLAVEPLINDLSGTTAISATLYYRHSPDTPAWASSAMVAQVDGSFLGYIPASVIGVDTTNLVEFVIESFDIFGHTQWVGRNGDTSFASLAAAQAAADTVGLVEPTVQIQDANDTGMQYIASGLVFNAVPVRLEITTAADTVQVVMANQNSIGVDGPDSFCFKDGSVGLAGDSIWTTDSVYLNPVITNDGCTWVIRVIASDTDGGGVQYDKSWSVVVDTATPLNGKATVSDTAWSQIVLTATPDLIFNAYDSYGIDVVGFWGDVTSNTVSFTGAATNVTLTAGEGWKNIFHQYLDVAGNLSATFSDSIYLDVTSATLAISPLTLITTSATYTCTGSVADNYVDTPVTVFLSIASETGTLLSDSLVSINTSGYEGGSLLPVALFSTPVSLLKGLNLITVTASDTAGHTSRDNLCVFNADEAATEAVGPMATLSDTAGGVFGAALGSTDYVVISVGTLDRGETLTLCIDFALPDYSVVIERFDTPTLTDTFSQYGGAIGGSWGMTETTVFRITVLDSQGHRVDSGAVYDSITIGWNYSVGGGLAYWLDVYAQQPSDSQWMKATDIAGLIPGGAAVALDTPSQSLSLRLSGMGTFGIFIGRLGNFIDTGASAGIVDNNDYLYFVEQAALYWGNIPGVISVDLSGNNVLDFEDVAEFGRRYGQ